MAASNTRFTQNRLGQSKNPIDSDHGIYRYGAASSSRCSAARRRGRWLRVHSASPGTNVDRLRGFRHGLQETCHAEDQNVAIEYRGLKIKSIGFLFAPGFRRAESLAIAPLSFFDLHHKSK